MRRYLLMILGLTLLASCGGDAEVLEQEETTEQEDVAIDRAEKTKQVFYTLPSPIETASIFENSGTTYNSGLLNSTDNLSNYSTNSQKALNFGCYGADLNYTNIFNQTNGSMVYMNCVQKLASSLGLTTVFDGETMGRIEKNINERDSLMIIINDAYWQADAYLKENEQDNLSALIIYGGWIECLYLGSQSIDPKDSNSELIQRIADQKYALENLVGLLQTYNDTEMVHLTEMLIDLQKSFNKIEEKEAENTVTTSESGIATIGGGPALVYDENVIMEITDKVEKIRNEIIQ